MLFECKFFILYLLNMIIFIIYILKKKHIINTYKFRAVSKLFFYLKDLMVE